MITVQVQIEGITPLIVNRFHEDDLIQTRKERPGPEEDAANRLYRNGEGTCYPAENIRQSIIGAAARHKIGRRAATTDVAAGIYISPFELPLTETWHVDSRAVVIKATGGRVMRHRPMFDEWSINFQLRIDTDLVSERLMRDVLDDAGKLVGLGDFRPAKKGQFGRFSVTNWEREKA